MDAQLLDILYKIKTGELSVEQGARQVEALEQAPPDSLAAPFAPGDDRWQPPHYAEPEPAADPFLDAPPEIGRWRNFWLIPFGVGTLILVLSAALMAWAFPNERMFWFYCSWLPMLLGLTVLIAGAWSRQARWAHIRIHEKDGTRIAISLPLPLRIAGWFLRVFGSRIQGLQKNKLHEMWMIFDALEQSHEPLWVDVEEEDGTKVKVSIL